MLKEFEDTRQIPGEGVRRWFTDDYFDLIVWFDDTGAVDGFQLCYDKGKRERALTWRSTGSYIHEAVDDGELYGRNKMTPIMVQDGAFEQERVSSRFSRHAADIDPGIKSFVIEKLAEYSD